MSTPEHASPSSAPSILPPLRKGEYGLPLGRYLAGLGSGVTWFSEAWRLLKLYPLQWLILSLPVAALLACMYFWPDARGPALLVLPFALAALLVPGRAVETRGEINLHQALALVYLGRVALLWMGAMAAMLWYAAVLGVPMLIEPASALHAFVRGLALWVILGALAFAPFLYFEQGLSPARAMLGSLFGSVRNLQSLIEFVVTCTFASVLLTAPLFYILYFTSAAQLHFDVIEVLSVLGLIGNVPAIVISSYTAYRAMFVVESPPEEKPLHLHSTH